MLTVRLVPDGQAQRPAALNSADLACRRLVRPGLPGDEHAVEGNDTGMMQGVAIQFAMYASCTDCPRERPKAGYPTHALRAAAADGLSAHTEWRQPY